MSISIRLTENSAEYINKFSAKITSNAITEALTEKMTYLMTRLQEKIRAGKLSEHNITGEVSDSIRNPRAEQEGSNIVGKLDWGGVYAYYMGNTPLTGGVKLYDIAQILESGSKEHPINPLTEEGTRPHEKGLRRRYGANILHFFSARLGKEVFADYVFHPGTKGIHFMEEGLEQMKGEVAPAFEETISEVLTELKVRKNPY